VAEKRQPTDGGGIIARIEARADTGERRVIDHGYNTDLARWVENQAAALRAAAGNVVRPIDRLGKRRRGSAASG
jgi:hypothetical protein